MSQTYFQRGFGLQADVRPQLRNNFRSPIVDVMRANGFRLSIGDLTFRLASEFGFCYGVERAVEYAYETVIKFPDWRIFLTGEIIHNPHVNTKLERMGIRFLPQGPEKYREVGTGDVVIIPTFGVPSSDIELLGKKGCIVVDTTCGSVLNVWKNVERYARHGVTSVIHGKYEHEETKATFSRTTLHKGAHYLVLRDRKETAYVCDYIVRGGDRADFLARFQRAISENFDPDVNLERVGLANQTTMLSSESLEIAGMLRSAMEKRFGQEELAGRFFSFDTICSATQDRQDAVGQLRRENVDLVIVLGGYNSSNTTNLSRITSEFAPTYHIEVPACILSAEEIRHKPVGTKEEAITRGWLPDGPLTIGITAGASTPDNQIGETIERILGVRGTMVEFDSDGAY